MSPRPTARSYPEVEVLSSHSPDRQSGGSKQTKALKMAKKSMLKAKRSAKEDQKPTALEALLQTLTKAKEEAIAPQRKKARVTKQEQPQTADAEAAAESETEQEETDQMRDTDEGGAAATSPSALDGSAGENLGEPCWEEMTRREKKHWKSRKGR